MATQRGTSRFSSLSLYRVNISFDLSYSLVLLSLSPKNNEELVGSRRVAAAVALQRRAAAGALQGPVFRHLVSLRILFGGVVPRWRAPAPPWRGSSSTAWRRCGSSSSTARVLHSAATTQVLLLQGAAPPRHGGSAGPPPRHGGDAGPPPPRRGDGAGPPRQRARIWALWV
jgi:hypothetical protein